jgi:hypothetical protein
LKGDESDDADDITITVNPATNSNQPPVINAGPDRILQ